MSYKFLRQSDASNSELELVEKEAWFWEAVYTDNSVLKQFDDDGFFHQFQEIEQDKLAVFTMRNDDGKSFSLVFPKNSKLIHFYRNMMLENATVRVRLYVFGYQDVSGKKLFVIMPDGNLVITDDVSNIEVQNEVDIVG